METQGDKRTQTTDVTIFGDEYALSSQEAPEYTQKIADFVDCKMSEIASEQNLGDPTKIAIMAAMDIADRLLLIRAHQKVDRERAVEALRRLGQQVDGTDRDGEAHTGHR